jgi:isopenicillin N synthase-like dioxygenase
MRVQTVDFTHPQAGQMFVNSLQQTGFALIKQHPVPKTLLQTLYSQWQQFFWGDDKHDYVIDEPVAPDNRGGFIPAAVSETAVGHSVRDIKEFYHLIPGQQVPPLLEPASMKYLDLTFHLGQTLLGWLQQYAPKRAIRGLSEPLDKMLSIDASLLRILHYPALEGDEEPGAMRAAAHEDVNLMTILPVSEQPGLQVRDKAGYWHEVAGNVGDLIINSGDMLQEATGGFFPSTPHQVVNPEKNNDNVPRMSIPYFLTPRLDVRLSAQYTAGQFLAERLALLNR